MSRSDHTFQKLCHEAVLACGPDMAAIERYVADRLRAMGESERAQAQQDVERILRFAAPAPGGRTTQ